MTLQDLPLSALHALAFALYLITLVAVFCAVRASGYRAARKTFFFSLLAALVSFLPSSGLANYFVRVTRNDPTPAVTQKLLSLRLWQIGLLAAVSLGAVIVMLIRTNRTIRQELSAQSVCEGLDQLPDGVCYSMPDGFPKLANNQMQRISNTAFGLGVLDTNKLRQRLENRELTPGCEVDERDGNLFLRLPDGSVWQIKEQTVRVDNRDLSEMIAYDVTQRYHDLMELEQRNMRLEAVNRQIKAYNRNMDRIVREKEILAAKIHLHGNLGQCLLAIQSYLSGMEGSRETVTEELKRTVSLLRNNTAEENSEDRLYALYEAAKVVGVTISLDGEIPPQWKEITEVAIHECLTNTVKHADGRRLDVTVRQEDGAVCISLTNDGKPPAGPIHETGGLKNLRALAERRGGTMDVESEPAFRLTLRFGGTSPAQRA